MLIMNQSKKNLVNMETASEIFLSTSYGEPQKEGPVRVLAMTSVGISDEASIVLGEYESEARAMEVLEEIVNEYSKLPNAVEEYPASVNVCAPASWFGRRKVPASVVNLHTQTFVSSSQKVYRMPER